MSNNAERVQVNLEFPINCSSNILFPYLSTSSGLSEWFAPKVDNFSRTDFKFTFEDGEVMNAKLTKLIPNKLVRFELDKNHEGEYFEMEIIVDELTEDVAIKITEFCNLSEKRKTEEVWQCEIDGLKQAIGG